ncbi:hypothetical protein Hsero_2452 [Herbaspirillum seropedicae SmR1]|uniref:Uncharacterized protein n=1 Tax=Herbaspirillum seropedicae (strain SmR1) TaxID=757424 RepID=D8IWD1_HERSS|nr:hypothetical protein Hsero_2452 [Herbaspirillum seropedicae SmR1]
MRTGEVLVVDGAIAGQSQFGHGVGQRDQLADRLFRIERIDFIDVEPMPDARLTGKDKIAQLCRVAAQDGRFSRGAVGQDAIDLGHQLVQALAAAVRHEALQLLGAGAVPQPEGVEDGRDLLAHQGKGRGVDGHLVTQQDADGAVMLLGHREAADDGAGARVIGQWLAVEFGADAIGQGVRPGQQVFQFHGAAPLGGS